MRNRLVFLLLTASLGACAAVPVPAPPEIVKITHTVYQPIPAAYLTPCLVPVGTPSTNSDLLLHDQAAMTDLMACNAQLKRIQLLPTPAPTASSH